MNNKRVIGLIPMAGLGMLLGLGIQQLRLSKIERMYRFERDQYTCQLISCFYLIDSNGNVVYSESNTKSTLLDFFARRGYRIIENGKVVYIQNNNGEIIYQIGIVGLDQKFKHKTS